MFTQFHSIVQYFHFLNVSKALDAYCLLEIYDYFRNRLSALGVDFEFKKLVGKKNKASNIVGQSASNEKELTVNLLQDERLKEIQKFEVFKNFSKHFVFFQIF